MSEEKTNGISTAEDFERKILEYVIAEIERGRHETVPLPSGLKVRLRHPGVLGGEEFLRSHASHREKVLEESERNKIAAPAERSFREAMAFIDFLDSTLGRIFIQPVYGAKPGEISFGRILKADLNFIFRWIGGEVEIASDGAVHDLRMFSRRPGEASASGAGSEDEPLPSELPTGTHGNGGLPN